VSADGSAWYLLSASPEIRQQIESFSSLHPRAPRDTPIQGIVLTNGDLDHCLGLLSLRESQPLVVYATERVWTGFTEGNVLYRTLERFEAQITWRPLRLGVEQSLTLQTGGDSGLTLSALPVPGKLPIHAAGVAPDPQDNVGLRIRDVTKGKILAYLPAVGAMSDSVKRTALDADAVFFDGTFWSSDELIALGVGDKHAEDMAHWPLGGPGGSLKMLRELPAAHRILIHINNTNPMLRDNSTERAAVHEAGVVVAHDGMQVSL